MESVAFKGLEALIPRPMRGRNLSGLEVYTSPETGSAIAFVIYLIRAEGGATHLVPDGVLTAPIGCPFILCAIIHLGFL